MVSVRSSLRARLQRGETIAAPGAYDPLSARVVQALGFAAVYTGGYMTGAHTSITEPLLTLTEQVEVAQKVAHAVDLPVITDAGAGYGDPLHVMRCVREFEAAGIAGIHIEDQVYPKRASYHKGLEHIVPLQEFVERMSYALKARRDPDFLIIGRTDAFSASKGVVKSWSVGDDPQRTWCRRHHAPRRARERTWRSSARKSLGCHWWSSLVPMTSPCRNMPIWGIKS